MKRIFARFEGRNVTVGACRVLVLYAITNAMVLASGWNSENVGDNSLESSLSKQAVTTAEDLLLVSQGTEGLVYQTYANEGQTNAVNTVPDYSRAGYMGGGVAIPFVPAAVTLAPSGGDDTTAIQNAIDHVSSLPLVDGFRGAVLLEPGEYTVSSTLNINASGVVIRGAGQQDVGGTRITYTATTQSDLFHFHGASGPSLTGSSTAITDAYVPVGSKTLTVADASTYAPGDLIRITNLMNQKWINDIGMTVEGGLLGTVEDPEWDPAWFQLTHYRYIAAVHGNEITLDAPTVQVIEDQYGGGTVQKCTYANAIENVGIENIRLESTYLADDDESHGWEAVEMRKVKNGWVRQVTARYFGMGLILVDDFSQFITVEDCAMLDPKSITTGGRKYSFNVDDSSYYLVQRTMTRGGRHDYASGSITPGPNVFVDGHATAAVEDIGPHFRYATGELYDSIKSDSQMNVQNRLNAGTTHGWSGAQIMFWNVDANTIICDAPVGAMNWSIGAVGTKTDSPSYMAPWEPFGIWQSHNQHVTPRSLYYAQLEERLGVEAVRNVILPQQESGRIWSELQAWAGDGLLLDAVVFWYPDNVPVEVFTTIDIRARIRDLGILENLTSTIWSKVSGPGNVTFGDAAALATTMHFDCQGTYEIQLTADDGSRQVTGSLTVVVTDPLGLGAPAAPTGLVATPGEESVSLDWDDNSEPDLASYSVYRSVTPGGQGAPLVTGIVASAYVDMTSLAGTTYYYVVAAMDADGNTSGFSNEDAATPIAANVPPVFDADPLVETDAEANSPYSSSLADHANDGNGDPLSFSRISGPDWLNVATNGNLSGTPGSIVTGLNEWTVGVSDGRGGFGQTTLRITVHADTTAPNPPAGLVATPGDGLVTLAWLANSEADLVGYSVYRATATGDYALPLVTGLVHSAYTDATAENDTEYFYVVRAVDGDGNESTNSNEDSATPTGITEVQVAAIDNAFIRAADVDTIQDVSQTIRAHRADFRFGAREAYIRFPLTGEHEIGGIDVDRVDSVSLDLYVTTGGSIHSMNVYALLDGVQYDGTTLSESTWTGGTAGTEATGGNLTPDKRPLGLTAWLPVAGQTTVLLGSAAMPASAGVLQINISELEVFKQLIRDDSNGQITLLLNSNDPTDDNVFASVYNTSGYAVPKLTVGIAQDLFTLTVSAGHGTSDPPHGVTAHSGGTTIHATMLNSPVVVGNNTTQYVCTGWGRTGSEPGSGSGTNMSFTITNDTAIAWQWSTNYWINFEVKEE